MARLYAYNRHGSERAAIREAIGEAIEKEIGNRQGQRTDKQLVSNLAQVPKGQKTRSVAAKRSGFRRDGQSRQAKKLEGSHRGSHGCFLLLLPHVVQRSLEGLISVVGACVLRSVGLFRKGNFAFHEKLVDLSDGPPDRLSAALCGASGIPAW